MVDFKKTEQLYTKQGLVYQKKPHEIEYDRWYNSVTNPHKKDKPAAWKQKQNENHFIITRYKNLEAQD